jgi:enoyl-CoA hydratase/carnithine racemase
MTAIYRVDDGIAWLTLNRPEVHNALNRDLRAALHQHTRGFAADPSARVLVITGAGDKAFCAGGDLREMAEFGTQVPPRDFVPSFGVEAGIDKPVIAAVNGVAYAGGFLLAQRCDLVIAADHARFAITEIKVGRGAPWAVPLPLMIPPRVATELLMTGDPITAQRAYEVGLVNTVVEGAQLRAAAQSLAEKLRDLPPLSLAAVKRTVALALDGPLPEAVESAERVWEPVYLSNDALEGPRAFVERRPPVWTGR